ncbi:MAG: DUF5018 domain-containing protein [Bacteroidota bacterium]
MKKISILFLSLFVLAACSKDDDNGNGSDAKKSDAKEIISFTFLASENEALDEDVKATIDKEKKTIMALVPNGTSITSLKPTLTLSDKATVNPKDKVTADFSKEVPYTVTAEDGSSQKYTVTVTVGKSNAKEILSFVFRAEENEGLEEDIIADIDQDDKDILPHWKSVRFLPLLQPDIKLSEKAVIEPSLDKAIDFTNPVEFTVKAEDGSTQKYVVTFSYQSYTQKELLIGFAEDNPGNTLNWDFEEDDLSKWSGVTLDEDGLVKKLDFSDSNVEVFAPELTLLEQLESLDFFNNKIQNIPPEIKRMKGLEVLGLYENPLQELPNEIGELESLTVLTIGNTLISQLPESLINLSDTLEILGLGGMNLEGIPDVVYQLLNLKILYASTQGIETLSPKIGDLEKLEELWLNFNQIAELPKEIGNLKSLKKFAIRNNQLSSLPDEMGDLARLEELQLLQNNLTALPEPLCNLIAKNNIRVFVEPEITCVN